MVDRRPSSSRAALLVVAMTATTASCRLDSSGSGDDSPIDPRDSNAGDLAIDSLAPEDVAGADSRVDTALPTDAVGDTGLLDSEPTDATPIDDTTVPDATPTGSLTGTMAALPPGSTVNLTTLGTIAWAHWGFTDVNSWEHRKSVSAISKLTFTGGTAARYDAYTTHFTWTDGDPPSSSATATPTGVYHATNGGTFTFTAEASNSAIRTLVVYAAWNVCTGTVRARLSDGSATEWTGSIPPTGSSGAGNLNFTITLKYRAGSAGQTLSVELQQTAATYYLSVLAATLQ